MLFIHSFSTEWLNTQGASPVLCVRGGEIRETWSLPPIAAASIFHILKKPIISDKKKQPCPSL